MLFQCDTTDGSAQIGGGLARGTQSNEELVRERPAWIIPALVLTGVLSLSGIFLYYYFGPTPGELLGLNPRASTGSGKVDVIISETRFLIPEAYTRYPSQRSGGRMKAIDMHTLLPDMQPFSVEHAENFTDNSARSDVVYFSLSESAAPLNSSRRLQGIYAKYLESANAEPGPNGSQLFRFRDNSGYANQDLLVGKDTEARILLLICDRIIAQIESPNCSRSLLLGPGLELSYRYKRHHVEDWQRIDKAVVSLVNGFSAIEEIDGLQGPILD